MSSVDNLQTGSCFVSKTSHRDCLGVLNKPDLQTSQHSPHWFVCPSFAPSFCSLSTTHDTAECPAAVCLTNVVRRARSQLLPLFSLQQLTTRLDIAYCFHYRMLITQTRCPFHALRGRSFRGLPRTDFGVLTNTFVTRSLPPEVTYNKFSVPEHRYR
jgi:hypothetical protein